MFTIKKRRNFLHATNKLANSKRAREKETKKNNALKHFYGISKYFLYFCQTVF